jgi:DNA-binding NtrC family response regulator
MLRILVIEDDEAQRDSILEALDTLGYKGIGAEDGEEGLSWIQSEDFEAVLTDTDMPNVGGLEFLKVAREKRPDLPVVMVTDAVAVETAVEAMRAGAADFITKPCSVAQLRGVLSRILRVREVETQNRRLKELVRVSTPDPSMVGEDPGMKAVYDLIEKVAPTEATVLVLGESGTGKELVARAIHRGSGRAEASFVPVNCAAFTETLLESEVFGHEKGAFTGAEGRKAGLMEIASDGTLFLDEVGDTTLPFQAKLLRAIQEKEFLRVGGTEPVKVDTRFVAATNKDLDEEVKAGRFRKDLFYRLNVFPISIPPLRERPRDIPLLIDHFLEACVGSLGHKRSPGVEGTASVLLTNYPWPGNVRELKNVIERAVILAGDAPVRADHLPAELHPERELATELTRMIDLPFQEAKAQLEGRYFRDLIQLCRGNVSQAAKMAGLGRASLHEKLKKLGISADDYRKK